MKNRRVRQSAFNPDKFIKQEKKKKVAATLPPMSQLFPIRFSSARRRAVIAKLSAEIPSAFYSGVDQARVDVALSGLKKAATEELDRLGLVPQADLLNYLIGDLVSDPTWKRKSESKKNA